MSKSFEQAVYCINNGNLVESLKYFELALKEAPVSQHHVIHCNVGSALMAMEDLPSAIAAFDEALALKPDHIESLVNRGIATSKTRQFDQSLVDFSKACELSPKFHPALCGKSEALANLHKFTEAIISAQLACDIIPENPLGFADLGFAQLRSGQFSLASASLSKAIDLGDDSEETKEFYCMALTQQAMELEIKGERERAYQLLHRANQLSSTDKVRAAQNYHNEAILLLALERHEEAMDCFLKALKKNPKHFDANLSLGTLLCKLDYLPDSEFHLMQACELDLLGVEARFNLGVVKIKMGNPNMARQEWQFILDRIQPGEVHAVEALRLLDEAMSQAKKNGTDGRKETLEVANKIDKWTTATPAAVVDKPLPKTRLVLDGEQLMGMPLTDSQKLLQNLEDLTKLPFKDNKRVMNDKLKSTALEVQKSADKARDAAIAARDAAHSTSEQLMLACANATNLAGVAATNAFVLLDNDAALSLQVVESSTQCANAALDCCKLLMLCGEEPDLHWIEQIGNAVRESQLACEVACAQVLNDPLVALKARACLEAAREAKDCAQELGTGNVVPLLVMEPDGLTLIGSNSAQLAGQMTLLEKHGDVERSAKAMIDLANEQQQVLSTQPTADNVANAANISGVTAATAHALAEINDQLALTTAQAALNCANASMQQGKQDDDNAEARHAAAVIAMECAEICSSTCNTVSDLNIGLRDQAKQMDELANEVLTQAVAIAKQVSKHKPLPPMLTIAPYGKLASPMVMSALEFTKPRPLVLVDPITGGVLGLSKEESQHMKLSMDTLDRRSDQKSIESDTRKSIQSISTCKTSGKASLSGVLASQSLALAELNPELALEACNYSLRGSLAGLEEFENNSDWSFPIAKTAFNASNICSDACARVIASNPEHSLLWNKAKESSELATQTMKKSLDLQCSETAKKRVTPLAPLAVPIKSIMSNLPPIIKAVPFFTPRPLVMTDPVTGELLGLSKPDAQKLMKRLDETLDGTTSQREEGAKELMESAEQSILSTKKASDLFKATRRGGSDTHKAAEECSNAVAKSTNIAGVAAANAHSLADVNPTLAIRTAKTSMRISLASLEALELQSDLASECDIGFGAAQSMMESSHIVSETARRIIAQSADEGVLKEARECDAMAVDTWKKATEVAKHATEKKASLEYRSLPMEPLKPLVSAVLPSRVSHANMVPKRVPFVIADEHGNAVGLREDEPVFLQALMNAAIHEPSQGVNIATVTAFQAREIAEANPKLALLASNKALEMSMASLNLYRDDPNNSEAAAAAQIVMETSSICNETSRIAANKDKDLQTEAAKCSELANSTMSSALALASKSTLSKAIVVPFDPIPSREVKSEPLLLVDVNGKVCGMSKTEGEALLGHLTDLSIGNGDLERSIKSLIALSNEVPAEAEKTANIASVIAAQTSQLAQTNPDLALDACKHAVELITKLAASKQPPHSVPLARSMLQTSKICAETCDRVYKNHVALRTKAQVCAELANKASKLSVDLVKVDRMGNSQSKSLAVPFHAFQQQRSQLRSVPTHSSKVASLNTSKIAKETIAQTDKVSEACVSAAKDAPAKVCSRSAANAAQNASNCAAQALRMALVDPKLSLDLAKSAMRCANMALDCSEQALARDALTSDVAFRVSTSTGETARICLDVARIVSRQENASLAMKLASELTRRSLESQNSFRTVLGSTAYQEAKARLRHAEQVKKRKSMFVPAHFSIDIHQQ